MDIYKFGNNTYPRRIRRRLNLGHFFWGGGVRLMGREIRYVNSNNVRRSNSVRRGHEMHFIFWCANVTERCMLLQMPKYMCCIQYSLKLLVL